MTARDIKLVLLLVFFYNTYLVTCISLPQATKTAVQSYTSTAISGSPTLFSLRKRDVGDYQDNLDIYQNWASMCRGRGDNKNIAMISDQSNQTIGSDTNLSINNLWTTVTQTVNCGGGHAVTVTKTVTASSTSKPKPTEKPSGNSCTGQCWSGYLWRK